MNQVKLIASDMDHTLLTEKGEFPPNFERCVQQLSQCGVEFAAASGRPLYTLKSLFANIKDSMSFISDNGSIVCHRGTILYQSLLEREDYLAMIRFTEQDGRGAAVLCGLDAAYVQEQYKPHEDYLRRFYTNLVFVDDLSQVDVTANKFSIYFPEGDSREAYDQLFEQEYSDRFSVTVAGPEWIDIMNQGVTKGTGMERLGKELGFTSQEMMAFGDTDNDIEMLQTVKYSYIVRNAEERMRQYANFVADSNDNFGVLKVMEQVLEAHQSAGT
jgi:Cof subfamily protein (haloacid dehalogenase superfamily)